MLSSDIRSYAKVFLLNTLIKPMHFFELFYQSFDCFFHHSCFTNLLLVILCYILQWRAGVSHCKHNRIIATDLKADWNESSKTIWVS